MKVLRSSTKIPMAMAQLFLLNLAPLLVSLRLKLTLDRLGSTYPSLFPFLCFHGVETKDRSLAISVSTDQSKFLLKSIGNGINDFLSGINFYTQNKTTTSLWRAEDATGNKASVNMPTMR